MRTLSHFYVVQRNGDSLQFPVFEDELTGCELEMKRFYTLRRQMEAEQFVLEVYEQLGHRRAELQKLLAAPSQEKQPVRITSNRPGRWHDNDY